MSRRVCIGVCAVIVLVSTAWGQVYREDLKLLPNGGMAGDNIGRCVATADGLIAVGAPRADVNGDDSGAVYLFDAATGVQLLRLLPGDGAAGDYFGASVALGGGVVAVGARLDDDNGGSSGAAYLFDAASGSQLAKLLPDDGAASDQFGYAIAIADGVVAVGAPFDDDLGSISGAIYLFDAATGAQLDKLSPSDGATGDQFGYSVAMANGVVAGGAIGDDSLGSAYLFDATTGAELVKLLAFDGAAFDNFGWSIAVSDGKVVVGAPFDDDVMDNSGSAYVFDATTGAQLAKILADDAGMVDWFGAAVAIDNGVIAVGAVNDDDNGDDAGALYVFDAATGMQTGKVSPDNGAAGDAFGGAVALAGGVIAVGAVGKDVGGLNSGTAYVFDALSGVQNAILAPEDGDGAQIDYLGYSLAISDGRVAVGAPFDDDAGDSSGSVRVFEVGTGQQRAKLLADDATSLDLFGCSVAMDDGIVAVGAYNNDDLGVNSGAVYLFDAARGAQIAKLLPADRAAGDGFGWFVVTADGLVAIGAPSDDDNGAESGSAYLFDATTGVQLRKLLPDDGVAGARFGYSVAMSNGVVAVAAPLDDDNGAESGSVYLFDALTGAQTNKLLPADGSAGARFGKAIAFADGLIAVGAPGYNDNSATSGAAYLFDAATGDQLAKLLANDGAPSNPFGSSIAIADGVIVVAALGAEPPVYLFEAATGQPFARLALAGYGAAPGNPIAFGDGRLAVGAIIDAVNGIQTGSVYVYSMPCVGDFDGSGQVDSTDLAILLSHFGTPSGATAADGDLTADGAVNSTDLAILLGVFGSLCP